MSKTQWILGLVIIAVVGAVGVVVGMLISVPASTPEPDTAQASAAEKVSSPAKKEETKTSSPVKKEQTKKSGAKLATGEREPLVLSGTGEGATQAFTLDTPDTYTVEVNYQVAQSFHHFSVRIVNTENPENVPKPNPGLKAGIIFSELLNEDEAASGFQGSKAVRFDEPGPYVFDVEARGPWQLTLR